MAVTLLFRRCRGLFTVSEEKAGNEVVKGASRRGRRFDSSFVKNEDLVGVGAVRGGPGEKCPEDDSLCLSEK